MRKYRTKKSQSSIEFVIIVGAVLLAFITFLGILQKNLGEKNSERANLKFQELAESVQNELNIASKSTDGYQRTFTIQNKIEGFEEISHWKKPLGTLVNTHKLRIIGDAILTFYRLSAS